MSVAVEKAHSAKGPVMAMRMSESWMAKLAEGDVTPAEAKEIDAALVVLEERYPEINAYGGSAEEFAQGRGGGTGSRGGHGGRRRPASGKAPAKRAPAKPKPNELAGKAGGKAVPGLDPGARRRAGKRRRSSATPRVDRAIQQTGIPAAASSGGSLFMSLLGITVGLSLLYLVFTSAEKRGSGARAVPSIVNGVTRGLGRFLSLADVFPATSAAQTSAAGGAPSPSTTSGRPQLQQLPRQFRHRGQVSGHLPQKLPRWELEALQRQTGGTG